MRGEMIQIPLKADYHWTASETSFKWHFAGEPMIAEHEYYNKQTQNHIYWEQRQTINQQQNLQFTYRTDSN